MVNNKKSRRGQHLPKLNVERVSATLDEDDESAGDSAGESDQPSDHGTSSDECMECME